jgi:hypothetical protein
MTNILTAAEAATVLRCAETDQNMLALLPQVDAYLEMATGRDWTADAAVRPAAKAAARMLLVRWHEDPGGMAAGVASGFGLAAALAQLEALALQLESSGVPTEPLALVETNIAGEMAAGADLVLIFNHEMAPGAAGQVRLQTAAGAAVATTNTLDVTGRILSVNPNADLAAGAAYTLVVDHAADVFSQTIDARVLFRTAP